MATGTGSLTIQFHELFIMFP